MLNHFAGEVIAIVMFIVMLATVMIGFPVAFTLAGVAVIFAGIGVLFGALDPNILLALGNRYFGTMSNETLVAVPLFIFMGVMLERSRIAESLLTTMGELFGTRPGGLGYSVIIVGALLAASTGIVGATVVTLGLLSLPAMLKAGYDPKLASGTICAAGTLGQIIPPSTVLVFLADFLQAANQQAQIAMGNFSPTPLSVGQVFAGAIMPGFALVVIYMLWIALKTLLNPASCPPLEMSAAARKGLAGRVLTALLPPVGLIVSVLGSILLGVATPTEAASVGGLGAMIMAACKREFNFKVLREVMQSTLKISSMVFVILLGASVFSLVFRGLGGEELVNQLLTAIPGGAVGATLCVMAIIFILGFFLDTFEIIFIVVPIAAPVLIKLGVDPIWLGVAIGINLQTSYLTPPFGFALFYLRSVAPAEVKTADIYRGALPFAGLQILAILLISLWPAIATWLPAKMYSSSPGRGASSSYSTPPFRSGSGSGSVHIDDYGNLFTTQPDVSTPAVPVDDYQDLFFSPEDARESVDNYSDLFSGDAGATPAVETPAIDEYRDLFPE